MPQAQLVESRLINLLHYQTLDCVQGRPLRAGRRRQTAGGFRPAPRPRRRGGLLAARASYLTGFAGTATVLAGMQFGIPIFGTMAHSLIQAHDREEDAFERFAAAQPGQRDSAARHL